MLPSQASIPDLRDPPAHRRWLVPALGLLVFHGSLLVAGRQEGLWLPAVGIGIALVAWHGWPILGLLALDIALARWLDDFPLARVGLDTLLLTAQIGLSWWFYHDVARGAFRINDPRSATVFLLLVPGVLAAAAAILEMALWMALKIEPAQLHGQGWIAKAGNLWISRAQGILVLLPFLLVAVSPALWRLGCLPPNLRKESSSVHVWSTGDLIEIVGLALGNGILGAALVHSQSLNVQNWPLWGVSLLLIVWAALRQGLAGGSVVAATGGTLALLLAQHHYQLSADLLSPFQGNLLAQGAVVILVGASAGWIRASEARYRQIVGHMPVVLYSVHIPGGLKLVEKAPPGRGPRSESKWDLHNGPTIADRAEMLLVSPASREVLGRDPAELEGPYQRWLDRVVPEDRPIMVAALAQLCLQKQPVVCEYRMRPGRLGNGGAESALAVRWVRDTMAPYYIHDDVIEGWEGVVEDITEARTLAQNLRRTSNMFQALISNLPTGVFFVQGPHGTPILANLRARQVLGSREDLAGTFENIPKAYRLYKPDGTLYPADELPVAKALRQGTNQMANDMVLHRADGRRVPIISWAAPIDLTGRGKPDAAVWVLEDMTALQQAEQARKESESRLRAVIETMGEGVLIQNRKGVILEANPAAAQILGVPAVSLVGRTSLAADGCVREDGTPLAPEDYPEQVVLRTGQPVRHQVLGLNVPGEGGQGRRRWILVNAMVLPVGPRMGQAGRDDRVVTTFADITSYRQALDTTQAEKLRYQDLIESLPLMVVQFDRQGQVGYVNPAALQMTGFSADELRQPGFWSSLVAVENQADLQAALAHAQAGQPTRAEFHYRARDNSTKAGLGLAQPHVQDGALVGATLLVLDMTLQRRLEKELQRTQQLELVGRLASGVVHDFNNLLTIMIGLASLADAGLEASHPQKDSIKKIIDVGEQAAHLAGQLLAFSKQRRHAASQLADLNYLVVHSLKLLKTVMPPALAVESALSPEVNQVQGEDNLLKQVIMNLCLNARDAMPDGGTLTVRTEPATDASSSRWVKLTIADTGQGMDDAIKARIFEPFFSTKERGTGLGLAVVKQIVESLGGRIEVWSQPGTGTRMEVWLRAG